MRPATLLRCLAPVTFGLLVLYSILWLHVTPQQIGRSDFTSTYVGATLWSGGHHSDLYDQSLQAQKHAQLIAPDTEGNLPFVNPPTAAVIAAPLTSLGLTSAYRVWSLLQGALLVVAAAIAWRATPKPRPAIEVALLALAMPATLAMLLLGQWDGLSALGLAGAYALIRSERERWAGALLAITLLAAKPHLAIGIAAFALGWRDRKVLLGAALGAVAIAAVSLIAVGPAGINGWISIERYDASRWALASFLGANGWLASWGVSSVASQIFGAVVDCGALALAVWLGQNLRRGGSLELTFCGAVILSLVASPHLLSQDLALLVPCVIWAFSWARRVTPSMQLRTLTACVLIYLAAFVDFGNDGVGVPGRLVPVALGLGAAAVVVAARGNYPSGVGGSVA